MTDSKKQVIAVVDMNNLMYASAYNPRKHYTRYGVPRHIILGVLSRINNIRQRYAPSDIYIVWDSENEYWRKEIFEGYKQRAVDAKREKIKEDCALARPHLRDLFERMGLPQLYADMHEADDVFPVLIKALVSANPDVLIKLFTGDKDALQLVSKNTHCVQVLEPYTTITLENYMECTGYATPALFRQSKWLVQDTNDALRGVMEKKDAQLLLSKCSDVISAIEDPSIRIDGVNHLLSLIRQPKSTEIIFRNRQLTLLDGHGLTPDRIVCIPPQEPDEYLCKRLAKSLDVRFPEDWFAPNT